MNQNIFYNLYVLQIYKKLIINFYHDVEVENKIEL